MEDATSSTVLPGGIREADSIFQQPWWLEAVMPGAWGEASVRDGQRTVARLPYVVKKRYGLVLLTMPPLTATLGPWFYPSDAKYQHQLSDQKHFCQALITQLPRYDVFSQTFSPSVKNILPFYWAGFCPSLCYTYRLDDLTDLDYVWKSLGGNVRTDIRKAEKAVRVRCEPDIERFFEVRNKTFVRQGSQDPYSQELVRRVDDACSKRGVRRMYLAEDERGRIHAGAYIVWDDKISYYLMGGGDPDLRGSGAASLLIWEAIKFSSQAARGFDFEGSMLEPIERHFRAFGARQTICLQVSRMSRRMKFLTGGQQVLKALIGYTQ